MQSPPFPRYLVPPRSKYSPQHSVLKHPQLPCVVTLYLLKVHLQTFLSISTIQKCQILGCDTLVANECYVAINRLNI